MEVLKKALVQFGLTLAAVSVVFWAVALFWHAVMYGRQSWMLALYLYGTLFILIALIHILIAILEANSRTELRTHETGDL